MELAGRIAIVLGVSDETSIAWGIARAFHERGARVHIGYQQKFLSRVRQLTARFPEVDARRCDVAVDDEVRAFFERFAPSSVSVLVHAIAFGPPSLFTRPPSEVEAADFAQTVDVSAHSLCRVVRAAAPALAEKASVMTLTYQASQRAEPFYGLMGAAKAALESMVRSLACELGPRGVRVNAISPGPVETLAALGIMGALLRDPASRERLPGDLAAVAGDDLDAVQAAWRGLQQHYAARSPIRDIVSKEDVADCALFLAGDGSRKITGQVIHVDCGLSSAFLP